MIDTLPIYYNTDVLGFYQKQKSEFHFQQKTDNEFLMFLLDTAVRVISIVQHLAPVIEAVSEASAENELNEQGDLDQYELEGINSSAVMEVENLADSVIEEHIESRIKIPPPAKLTESQPSAKSINEQLADQLIAQQVQELIDAPTSSILPSSSATSLQHTAFPSINHHSQQQAPGLAFSSINTHQQAFPPSTQQQAFPPSTQLQPTAFPTSSNNHQSFPNTTQPSDPSLPSTTPENVSDIKGEVIQIKEEPEPSSLLSTECLQQLMNSVTRNEENISIQNFVTTAQPSSLPPSFLDRNTNPLSMLSLSNKAPMLQSFDNGNMSTDSTPGGSGFNIDMSKLDSKGNPSSANPSQFCDICGKEFRGKNSTVTYNLKRHKNSVHLHLRPFQCRRFPCQKMFGEKRNRDQHEITVHDRIIIKPYSCSVCGKGFLRREKMRGCKHTDPSQGLVDNVKLLEKTHY